MNDSPQDVLDENASPLLSDRGEALQAQDVKDPDFSSVRAIYFDLDDTLCAYWDASKIGLRKAFEEHGPEGYSAEEMVVHWANAFRRFAPSLKHTGWYPIYLLTAEPTRTEQMRLTLAEIDIVDPDQARRLSEAYMRERDAHLRLFPDALDVLNTLKPRFPLGLITNGPADLQRQEVATLGIEHYFANVYIEGEMGEGKPKRAVFERAAKAVGCEPHELLMVGNSFAHDIAPALEYGWHAVWVRRASDIPPSATQMESIPEGAREPHATIQHLSELLAFLPEPK